MVIGMSENNICYLLNRKKNTGKIHFTRSIPCTT